jgi:outer membrane protein assembly factor BamB
MVWFASPDGTVRCLKAADGKAVWSFPTGGMIFSPPTVWEGRLLVGGGDGRVYCLDAGTGRPLWRLAAAPADRRVFWFGHLISTWPVVPGVAVQDGVAYAVAGYQKENGIHAYAFDPKSGQVAWEKDDAGAGAQGNPGTGLGNCGSMALSAGRLWLSSLPAGGFDLKTGDWKSVGGGQFGCEVGALDKWTLQGGRRLSETQDSLKSPLGGTGFTAWTGQPQPAKVGLTDVGTSLPAWDGELVLMAPKGLSGALTAVPTAKMLAWLDERPAAQAAAAKTPANTPKPKLVEWPDLKVWATEPVTPAAFALAKDQVVVAHSDGRTHRVLGYRRTDGSKAWTVDLPDQPAMNRLAVDRDGRVLVSLCDGSVVCLGR